MPLRRLRPRAPYPDDKLKAPFARVPPREAQARELFHRLRWPVALFGSVTVAGTVGYRLIEGWSWLDALWARGLAVATSSDAVNVFVTLTAHHLNPSLQIITQVDLQETAQKARRAGASGVVNPHAIGGTNIANALLRPHSATFMENAFARSHPDLAMDDVVVGSNGRWRGKLKNLQLRERFDVLAVAVRRAEGELVPVPGPDCEIHQGDVLVLIGKPEHLAPVRADAASRSGG